MDFCTGVDERKAKNLRRDPSCARVADCDSLIEGLDLVVEVTRRRPPPRTTSSGPPRVPVLATGKFDHTRWRFDGLAAHDNTKEVNE